MLQLGDDAADGVDQPIDSSAPTFGAFAVVLVSLTAVIGITQALHDFDLMTSQGQTVLVFVGITGLIVPLLVLVIAPIALLIAVVHVLNKLSADLEIVAMNASGMSFLPVRRRAKDDFKWRSRGVSALRFVQSNRGFKQGRPVAPCGSGPGSPCSSAVLRALSRCCTRRTGDGGALRSSTSTPAAKCRPYRHRPRFARVRERDCRCAALCAEPCLSGTPGAETIQACGRARQIRAEADARAGQGDRLRLRQSPRRRRRQRADLLRRIDDRSRQGDLRRGHQASARGRQCPPQRSRRQGHLRRHHGSVRRLSRRLRQLATP